MSAINLRNSQNSPLSKPRAVYSIDQILGNHHHRRNINGKFMFFIYCWFVVCVFFNPFFYYNLIEP